MVEDNLNDDIKPEDIDEETGEIKEPVEYQDLVTEETEREVNLGEQYDAKTSVTETEEDAPQQSDIKAILSALTPKFKNKRVEEIVKPAMVSRIFPDNLLDKNKLIVLSLIEEYNEEDDIPVIDIIMNTQDGLSIGYEGRGIVERLELAGVVREEEMEKLAKDLGL